MKRLLPLAPLLVAIVFPFITVQACGPFFFDDVFVRPMRPDHPKLFVQGKLGVLLPTYPRADLAVAYRYLNGGTLSPDEQKGYKPTSSLAEIENEATTDDAELSRTANVRYVEPSGPADEWLALRNKFAPLQADVHDIHEYGSVHSAGTILAHGYFICQADAFRTAQATLQSRAKTWGAKSAELANWIKGQDAVFSNCGVDTQRYYWGPKADIHPSIPIAAPASAPVLLRQDRAYQMAAALFYTSQFAAARAAFQAIAEDKDSPWRGISAYLVARCMVREAYLTADPGDNTATFKPDLMRQAQQQLESIRDQHLSGISHHGIQQMLDLIRLRTEPDARLREISNALASAATDPDYAQNLEDLTWYLNGKLDSIPIREDTSDFQFKVQRPEDDYSPLTAAQKQPGFEDAFNNVKNLRAVSPLIDWLITFQSPSKAATEHAISEWKRTGTKAWLVVALAKASSNDKDAATLIEAAGSIPSTGPAYPTAEYHRIRLMLDSGHAAQARSEIAAAFPSIQALGSDSALNLFTGLRMRTASSLDEALPNMPRRILDRVSTEQSSIDECLKVMTSNPKRKYDCKDPKSSVEFSGDSAEVFNSRMTLSMLAQAAKSSALPSTLRQSVAMMTWTRAVLLKNDGIAAQTFPMLPAKLQQQAGPGTGFRPLMTILRNPGLRPYLDPGIQRAYSYDFVESYSDNWWCADWSNNFAEQHNPALPATVAFLPAASLHTAEQEMRELRALGGADEYLGSQVIAYANANPHDPDVPEALYLTLRMIRYGCYHEYTLYGHTNDAHPTTPTQIAQQVVALMRRHYITSPWTRKSAPLVYLGDTKTN